MLKPFKVEVFQEERLLLYLPVSFNRDSIPGSITLGTRKVEAECRTHPNGRNVIGISSPLADALHLPRGVGSLHLHQVEEELYLGALIGIFTAGFTQFKMNPVGERSRMFQRLLAVQGTLGVIPFVFGEHDIQWEDGLIHALFHFGDQWERHFIPFPTVIYDRLPNRRSEKKRSFLSLKERLQGEYGIPWYNPGFFNKLDLFERLAGVEEAAAFLPETHQFQSISDLERMLATYRHVYVKPANGSLGNGIHKITYDRGKDGYFCRFKDGDQQVRLLRFKNLESLVQSVMKGRKLDSFIIQQGINLIEDDHRPLDFRVHTNKDDEGRWHVSAIAAKVAGSGSVTTHAKSGGEVKVLSELFAEDERHVIETRLKDAAIRLSHSIEANMEGYVGEIGFDLGVDESGRIWMFEANSKPGRSIFTHPSLKAEDVLTRKLALSFGVFLSRKTIEELVP
ncbi:YheC/YheD family protein [Rossellomorea marisflavi]|uniref:YheC/YheD family endospore coat-associated protein n=1 Tax=Rossellomorea marisflavi TaxID=189381 RepID=UPI001EE1CECF|nr:YheC/YheD family protein [Rossellomorea marisflavi]UKS66750.1 YheC/YheD family protein [Rossellomorea marisflavi]